MTKTLTLQKQAIELFFNASNFQSQFISTNNNGGKYELLKSIEWKDLVQYFAPPIKDAYNQEDIYNENHIIYDEDAKLIYITFMDDIESYLPDDIFKYDSATKSMEAIELMLIKVNYALNESIVELVYGSNN